MEAFHSGYLTYLSHHQIWFAEYGNPNGTPVIALHGGPGAGCDESFLQFFDLSKWRVILFDQIGCHRSTPFISLEHNTTQDLVAVMEQLRNQLNINQWVLLGGSWGSLLALVYAQTHPQAVLGLILRGIFLGQKQQYLHIWHGLAHFFPEYYEDLLAISPTGDLIQGYYQLLTHENKEIALKAAKTFCRYDFAASYVQLSPKTQQDMLNNEQLVLGVATLFTHYCIHHFFINDTQLMEDIGKINHLPLHIINGRLDLITPTQYAYQLHQAWPNSKLHIVEGAGHSQNEPGITQQLMRCTAEMLQQLSCV
jgi:proline iminopeptidase